MCGCPPPTSRKPNSPGPAFLAVFVLAMSHLKPIAALRHLTQLFFAALPAEDCHGGGPRKRNRVQHSQPPEYLIIHVTDKSKAEFEYDPTWVKDLFFSGDFDFDGSQLPRSPCALLSGSWRMSRKSFASRCHGGLACNLLMKCQTSPRVSRLSLYRAWARIAIV